MYAFDSDLAEAQHLKLLIHIWLLLRLVQNVFGVLCIFKNV